MVDSPLDSKREEGLLGYRISRVPMESGCKPSQPPAHGRNLLSQHAPQVLGGTGDRNRHPQCQAAPTAYGNEGGGTIRGFTGSLEGLQRLRTGRALDFLAVYGVGLRTVRLLRTYWYLLTIMAKAGG